MKKVRLAALFATVMMGMMSCSGTPAYAQENGNTMAVEKKTAATEKEPETESSQEEPDILSSVPLDPSVLARLTAGMDPDIVEVLLENPKLMALLMPTLHVTVTDSTVKIAFKEQEPAETVMVGTVRTNGGNLNVRAGASISSAIISQLKNGTEVKVLGEKDGWYEIEIPSEYAWVCGKYLQVTRITPQETEEGYTFDIDGEMMLGFLKLFEDCFRPEPEPVPADPEGLTPDGNLTLVDDLGPATGVGQQFLTMVSKNGNYFYMVIDRNDKGEENVHLLNLVDERDLMDRMAKDDKGTYEAITEAEKAAAEAAAQAEKEAAEKAAAEAKEKEKAEKESKKPGNMASLLLLPVILAAAGGAWFFLQTKKKKKATASPDPDAGYSEDEDEDSEDYAAGDGAENYEDAAEGSDSPEDSNSPEGSDDPEDSDDPESNDDAEEI